MWAAASAQAVTVPPAFTGTTAPNWTLHDDAALTAGPALNLDPDGQGWLRLTPDIARPGPPYVKGSAIYNIPFSSSDGIQATFQYATYRDPANTSSNPLADGLSFYLFDGTANSAPGAGGGSLGYSSSDETAPRSPGVTGGYVGVGLTEWGAFSLPVFGGSCAASAVNCTTTQSSGITVRGAGTGTSDYAQLAHANASMTTGNRAGARTVRVTITPAPTVLMTVEMDSGSGFVPYIQQLPLGSINGAPPATFKLGFSAANGQYSGVHEVRFLGIQGSRTPTVTLSANRGQCGPATLTATVAGDGVGAAPTGTVTFVDQGGATLGTATVDPATGHAQWAGALPSGVQTVTARYAGDPVYVAGTSSALAQTATTPCPDPIPTLGHWAAALLSAALAFAGALAWRKRQAADHR